MTSPAYRDDQITVHLGDCLDILPTLPDCSVDAIVTDPPYGIGFMGKPWDQPGEYGSQRSGGTPGTTRLTPRNRRPGDTTVPDRSPDSALEYGRYDLSAAAMLNFQRWCQDWAAECLRILKPGGHLLAFGGTRTWHRLAVAIEDAGFTIRDTVMWVYASGFPKSLDVSKAIDRAAGTEREVIGPSKRHSGRSSESGAVGDLARYGTAGDVLTAPATDNAKTWAGWGTALKPAHEPIVVARKPLQGTVAANVLQHGTGALNIDACRIEGGARPHIVGDYKQTDNAVWAGRMDGSLQGGSKYAGETMQGRWPSNVILDEQAAAELDKQSGFRRPGERPAAKGIKSAPGANGTMGGGWSGSAQETREVLDAGGGASRFFYTPKASSDERPTHNGTNHPTVKPVSLISWLIRLCCPPHGTVLDPFAGTGTTAEAALLEHKSCILIEREPDYLPLITARLNKPIQIGFDWETT